ncbi:MAG: LacI family DNA-binding transcriptional regulator [Lachnospiraceae bacterium]|nr:LacI family DNA-binding transcriptional regulator [Lachnospiraceae bacterium]
MAVSAKEIAKHLNISAAAVSMALNNKPGISEMTRQRVFETARELGYDFTRKQEAEHAGTVKFVIYKKHGHVASDTPFFAQVTEGIQTMCRQNQLNLQVTYFYEGADTAAQRKEIESGDCIGVILLGTEMEAKDCRSFQDLPVPYVVLDSYFEDISCNTVMINNVQGAYLAVRYLIENGHRRIGYLRSATKIGNFGERADGYYKALRSEEIPTGHPYVVYLRPTADGAYEDMKQYLAGNPTLPTAYFADNDLISAGALRALKEAGYKIPEDISMIGFDDMPFCEVLDPPLTTMNVPKQKLGAMAVERLIALIRKGETECVKMELAVSLINRQSVKNINRYSND